MDFALFNRGHSQKRLAPTQSLRIKQLFDLTSGYERMIRSQSLQEHALLTTQAPLYMNLLNIGKTAKNLSTSSSNP